MLPHPLLKIRPGALMLALAAAVAVSMLSGCFTSKFKPIKSLADVKDGETVIVGRVVLVPPLKEDEQILDKENRILDKKEHPWYGKDSIYRNATYMITDEKWRKIEGEIGVNEYMSSLYATFGETFYWIGPNRPHYILLGFVQLENWSEISGRYRIIHSERAYLPGGLKIDIRPGDKAVYIGTIKYYRNEYFDITKAEINDEFRKENAAFKKKFGTKYPLKKRIVKILKGKKLTSKKKRK